MSIDVKKMDGEMFREWLVKFSIECTARILRELLAYHPGPQSRFDIRIVWLVTGAINRAFEPQLGVPIEGALSTAMQVLTELLSEGFVKQNMPPTETVQ